MALSLPQKALRAVQDTFSFHQTLRCRHAAGPALDCIHSKSLSSRGIHHSKSMSGAARERSVALASAMVDTMELEMDVLGG